MAEKLNPKVLAVTFTMLAFVIDIAGYVWHGLLRQPSLMNLIYPGFWGNWTMMLYGLAGCLISAYILGYVFAWTYNWATKKFK